MYNSLMVWNILQHEYFQNNPKYFDLTADDYETTILKAKSQYRRWLLRSGKTYFSV